MAAVATPLAEGSRQAPQIVTAEDAAAAASREDENATSQKYEVVKLLEEGTWLVQRRDDPDAQFLGVQDDMHATAPQLTGLLRRGTQWAFDALLFHPNLICSVDTIRWGPAPRRLILWEYCDAGSLRGFMERTRVPMTTDLDTFQSYKWLPESLCWHVVISVLGALAWLHEGYHEEDSIEEGPDGQPTRGARVATRQDRGEDWLSVLHRNVSADNIYFQHPKGTETYGLCKLGNYGKVFVSGHVNDSNSSGHVVCSEDGVETLGQVIENTKAQDVYNVDKTKRPYFKGTEVYHLGEVLYEMMTKQAMPDKEECPNCNVRHWTQRSVEECAAWPGPQPFDLEAMAQLMVIDYSAELVGVLRTLLSNRRASVDTTALLVDVKEGYLQWKEETPKGQRYRDHWDDLVTRDENTKRKRAEDEKAAQAQSDPDAVDYVQLAIQWAKDNAPVYDDDENEAATATATTAS